MKQTKQMTKTKNTMGTLSSMGKPEMREFEKLGFNRKFLETETGKALSQALSILQIHTGYVSDDDIEPEEVPAEHLGGVSQVTDVKN